MKALEGYSLDYYKKFNQAPCIKEFATIKAAAQYLSQKYAQPVEEMEKSIMDEANIDAIYFKDGRTLLLELQD